MIGYIYHITNDVNGKKYIGKTWNLDKRLAQHFSDLKLNKHHSHKLQRAVNKYGLEHFKVTYEQKEISTDEDLSLLEIQEIQKFDSYNNGYNETLGGEGNKTTFSFDLSVLLYQILQRYSGISRMIARYYDCDHTVIDGLKKNTLYSNVAFKEEEVQALIKKIGIPSDNLNINYKPHNNKKLNKEQCLELLSVITQKTGYDKTMCEIFNINSKVTYRLKKKEIYKEYIKIYEAMNQEEQKFLMQNTMEKYQVESLKAKRGRNCVKNPLTQEQINYILDNKDSKTRVQIGLDLGISADRVGSVILGKSYKDLVNNYYSSIK